MTACGSQQHQGSTTPGPDSSAAAGLADKAGAAAATEQQQQRRHLQGSTQGVVTSTPVETFVGRHRAAADASTPIAAAAAANGGTGAGSGRTFSKTTGQGFEGCKAADP